MQKSNFLGLAKVDNESNMSSKVFNILGYKLYESQYYKSLKLIENP